MEINLILVISAVIFHFFFDWVLQPRNIALTKKKDLNALFFHIGMNIIPFVVIIGFFMYTIEYSLTQILIFIVINLVSHTLIDWFLPPYKEVKHIELINWTALDQVLHLTIIFITLKT